MLSKRGGKKRGTQFGDLFSTEKSHKIPIIEIEEKIQKHELLEFKFEDAVYTFSKTDLYNLSKLPSTECKEYCADLAHVEASLEENTFSIIKGFLRLLAKGKAYNDNFDGSPLIRKIQELKQTEIDKLMQIPTLQKKAKALEVDFAEVKNIQKIPLNEKDKSAINKFSEILRYAHATIGEVHALENSKKAELRALKSVTVPTPAPSVSSPLSITIPPSPFLPRLSCLTSPNGKLIEVDYSPILSLSSGYPEIIPAVTDARDIISVPQPEQKEGDRALGEKDEAKDLGEPTTPLKSTTPPSSEYPSAESQKLKEEKNEKPLTGNSPKVDAKDAGTPSEVVKENSRSKFFNTQKKAIDEVLDKYIQRYFIAYKLKNNFGTSFNLNIILSDDKNAINYYKTQLKNLKEAGSCAPLTWHKLCMTFAIKEELKSCETMHQLQKKYKELKEDKKAEGFKEGFAALEKRRDNCEVTLGKMLLSLICVFTAPIGIGVYGMYLLWKVKGREMDSKVQQEVDKNEPDQEGSKLSPSSSSSAA